MTPVILGNGLNDLLREIVVYCTGRTQLPAKLPAKTCTICLYNTTTHNPKLLLNQ
ncbi:hypothetical protein M427DRAFT_56953 [Gonapodya prolifera JEL478]|uniref:Uncharacterized protein n=1 Tax=Gonapodya prolifera (strain JEL478) TaxID=1344416 RepID=A0A139AEV9_GONPJ|nr:hypothetical protein M427DRAFT_56953 [Gonapodya prolifera JEL478]|eukprot:KXS15341.1 hypothetical protein M427DRAFT_56953 [Gonapodya prolifera JEL478]